MDNKTNYFPSIINNSAITLGQSHKGNMESDKRTMSMEKDIIFYKKSLKNDSFCDPNCVDDVEASILKFDPKILSSKFSTKLDQDMIQKPMAVYGHIVTTDLQQNISMFCGKVTPTFSDSHISSSKMCLDTWFDNTKYDEDSISHNHPDNLNEHSNYHSRCNIHHVLSPGYSRDSYDTHNYDESQLHRRSSRTSTTNLLTIASQKLYELVTESSSSNRPESTSPSDNQSFQSFGSESLINYEIAGKKIQENAPVVVSSDKIIAVKSSTTPVVFLCRPQESRFVLRMSVSLIKTYQIINEMYYSKKRRRTTEHISSDDSFHRESKRFHNTCNCSNTEFTQSFKDVDVHSKKWYRHGHHHHLSKQVDVELSSKRRHHKHMHSHHHHHKHCFDHTKEKNLIYDDSNQKCPNCNTISAVAKEYIVKPGEVWMNRYSMDLLIGTGSFGQVVRANDLITGEQVAIKIIRNRRSFVQQAETEIRLLRMLARYQENQDGSNMQHWGANCIVRLKSHFMYRGHLCLVFELLTYSLYELLKNTGFSGVSLNLTKKFGLQLCYALHFLNQSSIEIIHCDLKPENILLVHPKRSAIKVVDFGSSCRLNERLFVYIQSRFYRAPEVLLYLPYNMAIDMWSLGCILVELHTGQPLFVGQFEHEQIIRIIEVIGMPPDNVIRSSKRANKYFIESQHEISEFNGTITSGFEPKVFRNRDGKKMSFEGVAARKLSDIIGVNTGGPDGRRKNESGHSTQDYAHFLDLIERMLTFDSSKRITPDEALKHPFFYCAENHSSSVHISPS